LTKKQKNLGAFFAALAQQKTGLSVPMPAAFPLQSLARPKG
jgi:hypothetical protein